MQQTQQTASLSDQAMDDLYVAQCLAMADMNQSAYDVTRINVACPAVPPDNMFVSVVSASAVVVVKAFVLCPDDSAGDRTGTGERRRSPTRMHTVTDGTSSSARRPRPLFRREGCVLLHGVLVLSHTQVFRGKPGRKCHRRQYG